MSPVVLQLFPTPLAHVAGSFTPLHNNIFKTKQLSSNFKHKIQSSVKKKKSNSYHSQREKKIFLPEFRRALLMLIYLNFVASNFSLSK
jgi:hypothetical protein